MLHRVFVIIGTGVWTSVWSFGTLGWASLIQFFHWDSWTDLTRCSCRPFTIQNVCETIKYIWIGITNTNESCVDAGSSESSDPLQPLQWHWLMPTARCSKYTTSKSLSFLFCYRRRSYHKIIIQNYRLNSDNFLDTSRLMSRLCSVGHRNPFLCYWVVY